MKPSAERAVIIVLDTIPELHVIRHVLHDRPFLREHAKPYDPSTYRKSTQGRFADQALAMTYYETTGNYPTSSTGVEKWKIEPSFEVRAEDIAFVKAAAERLLADNVPKQRLFNLVTRRRQSAKAILQILDSTD
ncbi:MAG: hypothetical protein ABI716_03780 [Candidatus Saccharibacteria bacterium]